MTSGVAKVTSKGQVTIPTSVREDFGIERGDELFFYKGLDGRMSVRIRRPRKGSGAASVAWKDAPKDRAEIRTLIERTIEEKHGGKRARKGANVRK